MFWMGDQETRNRTHASYRRHCKPGPSPAPSPECDGAVRFDDPDIGIDWHMGSQQAVLSDKDTIAPLLKDFDSPFTYEAAL